MPPGPEGVDRVRPGGGADGLHHRVHPLRQPRPGGEGPVRAELDRPGAPGLVTGGDPDPQPGARGRARSAAVATPPPAPWTSTVSPGRAPGGVNSIRYAVSQAVGRQAASAKLSSAGLSTRLAAGTRTWLGQRAGIALGQQRAAGVVGRVGAGEVRVVDHRVHDHLAAVLGDPGRVAAQDHGQPVGGQPDAAQRPDVVVVQRGSA